MVKIEEIRVGNWISMQHYEGTELKSIDTQVTVNNIERLVNNADSMMLKGIDITEERLLNLGFEKNKNSHKDRIAFNMNFGSIKIDYIFLKYTNSLYITIDNYIRLDNIKYIHQLQNLIHSLTQTQIQ